LNRPEKRGKLATSERPADPRPHSPGRHGELFAFHADRLGPTRTTKGEIMADARVQEPSPFILVCNAACNCAAELANLRQIWERRFSCQTDDWIDISDGRFGVLAASISRLMYDLKLLKDSFPAVAWPLRAVSSLPPPMVAGTRDAASYHDTVFDMANAFLHQFAAFTQCGREILDLVDGPAVPPGDLDRIFPDPSLSELRNKIAQKVCFILRKPLISSGLYGFMDSVQEFDANALIARLQHEAARALATSPIQSQGIKPDEGDGKDNSEPTPSVSDQATAPSNHPEENVPERLPQTDAEADSAKHTLAEPIEAEQPTVAAPPEGPPAVAAAGHKDTTPASQVTGEAIPHEATATRDPGRIEKPRSRAWCHDTPPGKESKFTTRSISGTQKEIETALDMRWPTITSKQDTAFFVVDIKKGKYAVYFQHQEQLAEASKRLEEFRTRTNTQQQTVTRKPSKKKRRI
jgi:hypothetical protein